MLYLTLEYTKSNVSFSAAVLPDHAPIQKLVRDLREGRNGGVTTGLYTLAEEREHNPFMLVQDPAVQRVAGCTSPASTLDYLRGAKNEGRWQKGI